MQKLILSAFVIIKIGDYNEKNLYYKVLEREIKIEAHWLYSPKYFLERNWWWISVMIPIITGIAGWYIRGYYERKSNGK